MTKVINFYGGPGAGKSTMAAQLFGHMKALRMNVEYVPEFAKQLTWRKAACLDDQIYVLGNQHHELYTLLGQVDYIITDSPLPIQLYYQSIGLKKFDEGHGDHAWDPTVFSWMLLHIYSMYDNVDFFVERGNRKFVQAGRNQNEEESKQIDKDLKDLLDYYQIDYWTVKSFEELCSILLSKGMING